MRVIEGGAIGSGFERVCEITTRWYRAHRNPWDTVRPFCVLLIYTMPVHSGTFGRTGDGIVHGHLNRVSPIGFDQRLQIKQ